MLPRLVRQKRFGFIPLSPNRTNDCANNPRPAGEGVSGLLHQLIQECIAILELRKERKCVSFQSTKHLGSLIVNVHSFEIPPNISTFRSQISQSLADVT